MVGENTQRIVLNSPLCRLYEKSSINRFVNVTDKISKHLGGTTRKYIRPRE